MLASALILSHFVYGNALLTGLPKSTLKPMQLLQNYAAKVLTKQCKYDSATEALKELHWLPIQQRCQFKTLLTLARGRGSTARGGRGGGLPDGREREGGGKAGGRGPSAPRPAPDSAGAARAG